jgi:hypothetical protein
MPYLIANIITSSMYDPTSAYSALKVLSNKARTHSTRFLSFGLASAVELRSAERADVDCNVVDFAVSSAMVGQKK